MYPSLNQFLDPRKMLEKGKDYRHLIILQTSIIFTALMVKDIVVLCGATPDLSHKIRDIIFIVLVGAYVLVLWDLLGNFTKNKMLVYTLLAIVIVTLVVMLFVAYPFHPLFDTEEKARPYLFLIHFNLFVMEGIVIYFTIMDIFSGKKVSVDKLWGSACIFLMIGLSFGSMYDLINILDPGCMGTPIQLGIESYTACIGYSMATIGGHDAYTSSIALVQNLGVIESVWANLFIVILVGRLLGRPDDSSDQ